ncbi:hypothetical protein L596_009685 [Steinernema carpocapsae]|uniref:Structural maintenance of chromosomes protein n=1 Tax=Steinernema carpocapsae TaxID=34508 RepID=A0A4U5PGD9_STECR|nr:hypothetical protein L596_009685 [Steinernema carpocapsae]
MTRALFENDIDEEDLLNMVIPPPPEELKGIDAHKRLMISSIEVENFKSYYGRQVIGPFHKNFTAIIGPNGSGKSNVIDSLLFVFGYRAAKIRSKKVSVLIHNSAAHDDIDKCRVQVNFQQIIDEPDGKYTVIPGSQFNVSRAGFKNNSSEYYYNGKKMQFKEVAHILRDVGIDLIHNRFLILQGEVEQISLMKPKAPSPNEEGMLEYLEDIIGCSRLKAPIERLNEKCTKLQDQRTTQFSRVKHAEREKEALENPVKEIMQHLRLENAITLVESKQLYKKKYRKEDHLENLTPKIEEIKDEIKTDRDQLKEVLKQQDEQNKALKALQKTVEQAEDGLLKTKTTRSNMDAELQQKQKELKRNKEKIEKLQVDIKKEEKKLAEYEAQPEKCEKKIGEQKIVAAEAEEAEEKWQKELDSRLTELEDKSKDLNEKKKAREQELAVATKSEDDASSKLLIAQEDRRNMCDEEAREETKMKEIEQNMTETEKNLEAKKVECEKIRSAIPGKGEAIAEAEKKREELKRRREELDKEIRPLRGKLQEEKSAASSMKSQNAVVNALMREREKGNIPGIYGRLGDLGGIPQKYDGAISTTCGALDNIVVSDVDCAQNCIKFLKQNSIGQATFIALDRQLHFKNRMNNKPETPENAPRLFDLITVKDKDVLPAFYYALQDTLYADDITSATRISMNYGRRWRVVTAKGELVDTGGTMTGGGNSTRTGRIGTSVRVDTSNRRRSGMGVEELEQKLKEMEKEILDVTRELETCNRQIDSLTKERTHLTRRLETVENEINNTSSRLAGLKESFKAQQEQVKKVKRNENAIQEATEKVAVLEKERDKAAKSADKIRSQVSNINGELQTIFDEIVGDCQKNLDEAKERKTAATKAVTKEQTALNTVSRNISKTQKKLTELNSDLERTEGGIESDEEKIQEFEVKLKSLVEQIEEEEKTKVEAEEALREASAKNAESNDEEIKLKEQLNELEKRLKEVQEKVAKIKHDIHHCDSELSKLSFQYVTFVDRLPAALTAPDSSDDVLAEAYNIEVDAIKAKGPSNAAIPVAPEADDEAEPMETDMDETDGSVEKMDEGVDEPEQRPITVHNMIGTIAIPAPSREAMQELSEQEFQFHMANLEAKKVNKRHDFNNLVEFYHKLLKYEKENAELEAISAKRDAHRNFLAELKAMRHNEFMAGFQKIGSALKEMYQMITLGGDASLDLVDSLDPFNEGVSFGVRPPKKSWKQITNLSGGEKTLSSLALVFALHQYKPTPLYVMDEIDAALDFRNVSIIGHYIKEKTKNAQFIIISLRNNMFELGDRLVGIYKTHDCTKNVCVDPDKVAKATEQRHEQIAKAKEERAEARRRAIAETPGTGTQDDPLVLM